MGPPGSGKSFIGNCLALRGIAHYVELEPVLVARFGQRRDFLLRKEAALRFIRDSYITQLKDAARPVAFESTGVSDRSLLEDLMRQHTLILAKIQTPRHICVERVTRRPNHLNLGNDPSATAKFYDFWYKAVEPTYSFAATIDGVDIDRALREIAQLLDAAA